MKVKEETRVVEQTVTLYIAEDGTEFVTEYACRRYEEKKNLEKLIEKAENLRIVELDDCLPLTNDGLINDNNIFKWYRLESKEDFDIVEGAYGSNGHLSKPSTYPEVICVETCGYEPYKDDAYNYHLTDCKIMTEEFWKAMGYKVIFEEIK